MIEGAIAPIPTGINTGLLTNVEAEIHTPHDRPKVSVKNSQGKGALANCLIRVYIFNTCKSPIYFRCQYFYTVFVLRPLYISLFLIAHLYAYLSNSHFDTRIYTNKGIYR
jgi:hypothetical protein